MSGVYSYNKLFEEYCWKAVDELPTLEVDVHADHTVEMSVYDDYETALEETWPDFIKDFYA